MNSTALFEPLSLSPSAPSAADWSFELNQLLDLPPLFAGAPVTIWESSLLPAADLDDAFSALDLTVAPPPPPPSKAPIPIAPAVLLPAAETVSIERRLKRAHDLPPRGSTTKKTYQAIATDLRGMVWLDELLRRSHDHCRLLDSPLKVAIRARNFALKRNSLTSSASSASVCSHSVEDLHFVDALKCGDAFLQPNQLEMRDRVLESCQSDLHFLRILLLSIQDIAPNLSEAEGIKIARRNLRKNFKQQSQASPVVPHTTSTLPANSVATTELLELNAKNTVTMTNKTFSLPVDEQSTVVLLAESSTTALKFEAH